MRKNVFDRWIRRDRAERYVERFGGKISKDVNGYTTLWSAFREPLAFVADAIGFIALVAISWIAWIVI